MDEDVQGVDTRLVAPESVEQPALRATLVLLVCTSKLPEAQHPVVAASQEQRGFGSGHQLSPEHLEQAVLPHSYAHQQGDILLPRVAKYPNHKGMGGCQSHRTKQVEGKVERGNTWV